MAVKLYDRLLEDRVANAYARTSNYYTPRAVSSTLPSTSTVAIYPPGSPIAAQQNVYTTVNAYATSPSPAYNYPQVPSAQISATSYPIATAPPAQTSLYTYATYSAH